MSAIEKKNGRLLRKVRCRKRVSGTSHKPRLTVFKSLRHIYAQVIDDISGKTLIAASTREEVIREKMRPSKNMVASEALGKILGQKSIDAGIKKLVVDRNGYKYHGKLARIVEKIREAGVAV